MKIGARVLKTGLAITLSIYLAWFFLPEGYGSLAAIGASLSTQPSIKQSFQTLTSRIISNIVGGVIAVFMLYTFNASPITIGVTCIITIAVLNSLNLSNVIALAVVNITVIMLGTDNDFVTYAFMRVIETSIGVLVSFLVNWLVLPPKYDKRFFSVLESTTLEVLMLLRAALRKNTEFSSLNADLNWAKQRLAQFNNYFDLIREDFLITPKQRMNAARRLVVYREMARATSSAVELLETIHINSQIYNEFPPEMRLNFRERIETLMSAHEQIILKFYGKVGINEVNYMAMRLEHREEYMQMFFDHARKENLIREDFMLKDSNSIIEILSASVHYEEQLERLNHIVRLYKQRAGSEKIEFQHFDPSI